MTYQLSDFVDRHELDREGRFAELGHADSPVPATLAYCDSVYYLRIANQNPNVSCVITTKELIPSVVEVKGAASVPNPRTTFYKLHERLTPLKSLSSGQTWVHGTAILSPQTRVGIGVVISEHVVVKGDVIIGDGCFIDVGAIIGAEGLLYYKDADANRRISHRGGVVIGTNATILANAVVAQGIHPGRPTVVGEHAIVGIATNVGHEAVLGKNVVISGNCVIARGAQIGDGAWIGASATVREYVQVGERANVKAGSVVVEDVPAGSEVSGNFAIPHNRRILQYLREKK